VRVPAQAVMSGREKSHEVVLSAANA